MSGRSTLAFVQAASICGAIWLAVAVGQGGASAHRPPSSKEVVSRVRRYVTDYRPRLAELVAEEEYAQHEVGDDEATRVLVSDFAVVRADDGMWVGFRDVWRVDGRELPERRARAERLFGAGRLDWTSARQIIQESARFNIAGRVRDFNTPIAALELVSESRAWCCRTSAREVKGPDAAGQWLVDVQETERPTLVRTPDGGVAYAKVQFLVEAETGAVTRFDFSVGKPDPVTLSVSFTRDASFDLWLPSEMVESFQVPGGHVVGRARYTRWRRFQASSRIIGG